MTLKSLPPEAVQWAAEEIQRLTGLVFQPSRRADFAGALGHAMRRAGEHDAEHYLDRVRQETTLQDELIAEITVGETYFFRDPEQLRVVRDLALGSFPPDRHLRIWSAGCATGEEPYTLAMLVRECGHAGATIIGTDLSRVALTRARKAQYSRWSLRGVSDEIIRAYFERGEKQTRPIAAIRGAVEFRYLNLAEDTYPSLTTGIWHMDIILCRNVLIYLDQATVARVASRLLESLSPDGWLFVGGADPMLGNLVPCEVVTTPSGLAYRRTEAGRGVMPARFHPPLPIAPVELCEPLPPPPHTAPAPDPRTDRPGWETEIRLHANRGEIEAAARLCERALERQRDSAELHYLQSVLLAEQGHYEAAAAAARRALYVDRDFAVAHLALGNSLARQGDPRGARVSLRNAQRLLDAM
ncbi:MAG TPA: protein-glutamate O-methyltransferase CheR, partial [Gemmatimonadales bacterium]|nr:protein-glutamate O-methyltransferase CheR [Gemmatimonadales bacterium]